MVVHRVKLVLVLSLAMTASVMLSLSANAQQHTVEPSLAELADRLDQTEQRLQSTERRLFEAEHELAAVRTGEANDAAALELFGKPTFQTAGFCDNHNITNCDCCDEFDFADCCDGSFACGKPKRWKITPFGKLEAETIFATDTAVSENYIVFAAEAAARETERIDITGQSSQVGLNIAGPRLGSFQVGGLVLIDFHGNRPSRNEPGAYFIRAYAELFNDQWRIAFGQMGDTIGGWNAETVNWPGIGGLGFLGANQRGTLRVDRYFHPRENMQWTFTGALTQPVVTDLAGFQDALGQDNGLPNFEGQIVLGLGDDQDGEKPLLFSLSGMYGEYFAAASNLPSLPANVTNTSSAYAVAAAMQWTGDCTGFRGQIWHGSGLGTYMGGISQTLNTATGSTIRSTGGFGQLWYQVLPRVRVSALAGIDNPRDADLSPILTDNQRSRNTLVGGNVFIDITDYFHLGLDVWGVQTDYVRPGADNDIVVVLSEAVIKF